MSTVGADRDTAFAGPAALAALVHTREATPRELVELYLRRIEALDPSLNAFRVTLAEHALAEAETLDGDRLAGPLAGVPIAVKDDIPLAGQVATKGTRILAKHGVPAPADAEALHRLRAAGAIPIGISNVPELMIFPWTVSAANGITRNPWDPSRTPGGSSGGSAAAVAAGLAPAATASDGGGSIRIPAACCGLVGMKPSRGRVSAAPGRPGWLGLSTYGALARTVADSALLLDAMQGTVAGEVSSLPRPRGSYVEAAGAPSRPLRIAISTKPPPVSLMSLGVAQRAVHGGTARLLEQLGHHVNERDPDYGTAQLQFTQTWVRGIYEEAAATGRRGELERSTREMAATGRYLVPPRRRRRLLGVRALTTRRITALWDEFDVLMTPALTSAPIAAEGGYGRGAPIAVDIAARMTPYTPVFNLTGQPAITVPIGVDGEGLPIAVQLVGRVGAEDVLYSLAGQLERAAPWAQRRPGIS